jgi:thiol-disulfide isomerase/thioredoxin
MNRKSKFIFLILAFFLFSLILNQVSLASPEEEALGVNFFHKPGCPTCAKEEVFLEKLEEKYPEVKVNRFSVLEEEGANLLKGFYEDYNVSRRDQGWVPITFIGERYFMSFIDEETTGKEMDDYIQGLLEGEERKGTSSSRKDIALPVFGKIDFSNKHPLFLSVLLGALDGFNACAMVALGFLLAVLIATGIRRRVILIGGTFILVSGVVYFFFITAWLNLFLYFTNIKFVTLLVGVVIILFSISLLRDYFRKVVCKVCEVGTGKKSALTRFQEKLFEKMEKFSSGQVSLPLALLGISIVAAGINTVELVCSLGLPVAFTKILTSYNLSPFSYYFYILVYVIFYMIDDFLIFLIAVFTLRITQASQKYLRAIKLISGLLLLALGLIMIIKPEFLSF